MRKTEEAVMCSHTFLMRQCFKGMKMDSSELPSAWATRCAYIYCLRGGVHGGKVKRTNRMNTTMPEPQQKEEKEGGDGR